MDTYIIYHNPRCSKSRAALALLQERRLPLRIVEYLKNPPSRDELAAARQRVAVSRSASQRQIGLERSSKPSV